MIFTRIVTHKIETIDHFFLSNMELEWHLDDPDILLNLMISGIVDSHGALWNVLKIHCKLLAILQTPDPIHSSFLLEDLIKDC